MIGGILDGTCLKDITVSVIGAGTIGSAIVSSLLGEVSSIIATRRKVEKLLKFKEKGVVITSDNLYAVKSADVVIFTLKPRVLVEQLSVLKDYLKGKIVISFAAAVSLEVLHRIIGDNSYIIRAMTNTAVISHSGFTVFSFREQIPKDKLDLAEKIFNCFGVSELVEEKYIDALTALSGSGPAYLYLIVESLVYGGLMVGLPRDLSLRAVVNTVIGASKLLLESKRHPSELKDMVVTPGGVTIEGIYQLEDNRIRTALMKAIVSATKRSKKISDDICKDILDSLN